MHARVKGSTSFGKGQAGHHGMHEGRMALQISVCRMVLSSVMLDLVISAAELGTAFVEGELTAQSSTALGHTGFGSFFSYSSPVQNCGCMWLFQQIKVR